jgi:hypothetical protein
VLRRGGLAVMATESDPHLGEQPGSCGPTIRVTMRFAYIRMVAAAGAAALILFANPTAAQSVDPKAGSQRPPGAEGDAPKKSDEFAEAAKQLGPAGNPECVWAGRLAVNLLIRNDLDTAFRHMELYDRFGCPSGHIQMAFRCLVRQGLPDLKAAEMARTHACWVNPTPEATAPPPSAAAPTATTNR